MKPVDFEYVRAQDLNEAIAALVRADGAGKILAGGQSLIPLLNMRLARPKTVIDINQIAELNEIKHDGNDLVVGATVRHRAVERSEEIKQYLPLVAKAMPLVGHSQIRNRGTMVGSIVHADPSAEVPLAALLLDAILEISGPQGQRSLPLSEFFFGYMMTDLQVDEIVTAVRFPGVLASHSTTRGTAFTEMARRDGDFALVSAACQMDLEQDGKIADVRLGVGGVGPSPLRLTESEESLKNNLPSAALFHSVAQAIVEVIEPEEDPFVSASYRRQVAVGLTQKVLEESWADAMKSMK